MAGRTLQRLKRPGRLLRRQAVSANLSRLYLRALAPLWILYSRKGSALHCLARPENRRAPSRWRRYSLKMTKSF